ncbi:hypothetical protein FB561_3514 [Kribbella amoyensis]|uniref:Uncharacterized protein n=1 Tax=Kribbella amoyensis TaxID=996641 RepID=A0A561BU17_9ACTN|nr:hypothetical protein [Kribbella amoyensis]TWD82384.1 hypothetical protein FB561_3514 [Kribbella amoyensis]
MASRRHWLWIAGASALVAISTYLLAVRTRTGRQLENTALRGADETYNRDNAVTAGTTLAEITIYSLAFACLACLASWWLARRGVVHEYTGRKYVPRVILVVLFSGYLLVSLVLGGILWGVPIAGQDFGTALTESERPNSLGATSLATTGSVLAALVFWASWRRLETRAPRLGTTATRLERG